MKNCLIEYFFVLLLLLSGCIKTEACSTSLCPPPAPCPVCNCEPVKEKYHKPLLNSEYTWLVTRVIDGDTIKARLEIKGCPQRQENIRLLNIDTPEKNELFFEESTQVLTELLMQKKIRLEFRDPENESRDQYGRLLAYVFVENMNINVEMVRSGYTTYWIKYGTSKRYHDQFVQAQQEAKTKKVGIWIEKN